MSERKNSRVTEHPKLLNPLSPINKKQYLGINSIKEENGEESMTFRDCENINFVDNKYETKKLENNVSNEEGEHSTSGSSKSQISSNKSNNSTPEACKIFNKNDNTPLENDDLFKITPHFINEASINKNIQLNFNINNNNKSKEKKKKYARPLTPNLNIIKKNSAPICHKENKIIARINNDKAYLINEFQKSINNNKDINNKAKEKDVKEKGNINFNMNINKILNQDIIKTDTSIKKSSISCAKNKILKSYTNIHTNSSINENNLVQNNYINKNNPIKNCIYQSINNPNYNYINKNSFSYNNNRSMQSKVKKSNKSNLIPKQKSQRNTTMVSRRNTNTNTSMNKSLGKNKINKNISKQNKNETIKNKQIKTYRSENKITVVHSKVNNEINNLFNGLSDNIVKDPEIHNKIESLIKDIKDIQQVVHRKTQSNFRPHNQNNLINFRQKEGKN